MDQIAQLETKYNRKYLHDADLTFITNYFKSIQGDEYQEFIKLIAYKLFGTGYQKPLILHGSGSNGKSTFLIFVEKLMGNFYGILRIPQSNYDPVNKRVLICQEPEGWDNTFKMNELKYPHDTSLFMSANYVPDSVLNDPNVDIVQFKNTFTNTNFDLDILDNHLDEMFTLLVNSMNE